MSEREQAIQLLETVPDSEMAYVIGYIQGLTAKNKENYTEAEPDEWDLKMIAEAKSENDGETVGLEEVAKDLGIML